MKSLTLSFLFFCLFISAASSNEQTKREKILHLIEIQKLGDQVVGYLKVTLQSDKFQKDFVHHNELFINPEKSKILFKKLTDELSSKDLNELFIGFYDKIYTEDEIVELTQFAQSSAGKKQIATAPALMEEIKSVMRQWLTDTMKRVKEKDKAAKEANS